MRAHLLPTPSRAPSTATWKLVLRVRVTICVARGVAHEKVGMAVNERRKSAAVVHEGQAEKVAAMNKLHRQEPGQRGQQAAVAAERSWTQATATAIESWTQTGELAAPAVEGRG